MTNSDSPDQGQVSEMADQAPGADAVPADDTESTTKTASVPDVEGEPPMAG